jgi:hypothetical protein
MPKRIQMQPFRSRVAALDHHERALAVLVQPHDSRPQRLLHFHRISNPPPDFRVETKCTLFSRPEEARRRTSCVPKTFGAT